MESIVKEHKIFALTMDPVYIGTGGFTIGRVDNTIVRDPITRVPKIPGSSLAGMWRYYTTLEILSKIKDIKPKREDIKNQQNGNTIKEKIDSWIENNNIKNVQKWDDSKWYFFRGNTLLELTCAGQDNVPQEELSNITATNKEGKTGHCGHCIVCKGFGFSKKDISWQGMIFFSDLNILFFPVFTMKGTKWITTVRKLKEIGINELTEPSDNKILTKNGDEGHINLGWLYLEVDNTKKFNNKLDSLKTKLNFVNFKLGVEDIIIVPENLFSQIVNSNIEVRTSVSIDPITGAAKEGALFTSEAIPRGTILYGNIRIFDKSEFNIIDDKLDPLPSLCNLECALKESRHFFETLGIGGMATRGFGRIKIMFESELEGKNCKEEPASSGNTSNQEKAVNSVQGGQK